MDTSAKDISATEATTESQHLLLQKRFLDVVHEMAATKCPLPNEFALYYHVVLEWDRLGGVALVTPFLTPEAAKLDQIDEYGDVCEDRDQQRRHDSKIRHLFIDSGGQPVSFSIESLRYPDLAKQ